jgi:hypothetical protein
MRRGKTALYLFSLAVLVGSSFAPGGARVGLAQVFSVDRASPLQRPADLFLPGPVLYARAEAIGLLAEDDIDALSFGFDDMASPALHFSVGFFTAGAILGGNAVCSEAGTCPPAVPCPPEATGDVFSTSGRGTAALMFDGDGAPGTAPALGLTECPAGGPGIQDSVDAFDDLVAPLRAGRPAWRVYLSLAPGSPTLAGANPLLPGGAGPGDILAYDPGHASLSVFFTAADLGLAAGDDIDGFSFNALTGDALFSLAPGSPSLGDPAICPGGCTAGDFLRSAGPICGALPCDFGGLGFASAGLAAGDDARAADKQGSPPPFVFDDVSPGKTYSLDPSSRSLLIINTKAPVRPGSPADLLTHDAANPTGAPAIAFRAESLGLVPADDIDGLSFGLEPAFVSGGDYAVEFSVDRAAVGAAGTGVFAETTAATEAEAASDVFDAFIPAPPAPPIVPRNQQRWDGNGSSAPTLQLRESSPDNKIGDDVDALAGPPRVVDRNRDGVRELPIYFSLAPGSPTLAALGASAADVLVCAAPSAQACGATALPAVFISRASLGLMAGDDLEDFSLEAVSGDLDFNVSPGSGSDPGAILKRPGFGGCAGSSPCTIVSSADLGLLAGDNLDALDSLLPAKVCVVIVPGPVLDLQVTHGVCPACPTCPPPVVPYDLIEGELGELAEKSQEVDLGRVFCRADALPAERMTLAGGLDPFTRPRFILVRQHGAPDYGSGSSGSPRRPSSGDCP